MSPGQLLGPAASSVKDTSAPPPGRLTACTEPPCATAMPRTMASPSPVLPKIGAYPRRIGSLESFEGLAEELWREAWAVIAYRQTHARFVATDRNSDH